MQLFCDGAKTNSLLIGASLVLHMYHNQVTHGPSIRLGCRNSRISILVAVSGAQRAVSLRVIGSSVRGAIQNTSPRVGTINWNGQGYIWVFNLEKPFHNFLKHLVALCLSLRTQVHVNNYLRRLFLINPFALEKAPRSGKPSWGFLTLRSQTRLVCCQHSNLVLNPLARDKCLTPPGDSQEKGNFKIQQDY